ncbi:MAG: sulfotransferase [Lysobacterales bacterium]
MSVAHDPLASIDDLMARRAWTAAARELDQFLKKSPKHVEALLRRSTTALRLGRYRQSWELALRASAEPISEPHWVLALARQLMIFLEVDALRACLKHPRFRAEAPAMALAEAGTLLNNVGANEDASVFAELAVSRDPSSAAAHYFRATTRVFFGDLAAAEAGFERCLALQPQHAQAHWALAGLRRQTLESNHVPRLQTALQRVRPGTPGEVFTGFALFSELNDLARYDEAWPVLMRACASKRQQLGYDHRQAMQLLTQIAQVCDADFCAAPSAPSDPEALTPIFIIGMHRSGTTLLERILGGHSQISDGGESYAFTARLKWLCDHNMAGALDQTLLERSRDIDFAELGQGFLRTLATRSRGRRYITEKLPSNFVNVGLIARALPQAKFLHMVRDPMDTCFSNLRTPFTFVCGYSYVQREMAEYFLGYQRLMAHWHRVLPGRVFDVNYRSLVNDPASAAQKLMAYLGLPFEAASLEIERNASAVATASSAQVRGGIRRDHTSAWKPYQNYLEPMINLLGAGD